MKCLTCLQPFASLIADGTKLFETRSWHPGDVKKIGIHAGTSKRIINPSVANDFSYGKVIAIAEIEKVWKIESVSLPLILLKDAASSALKAINIMDLDPERRNLFYAEYKMGEWLPGNYAWELKNIVPVSGPDGSGIPAKGSRKLWDWIEEENL